MIEKMTAPRVVTEPGAIYGQTRRRISELVSSLSADELARTLPACPDWTVRDVIGHMTGLVADVRAGRLDGVGTPEWTRAQVNAYAGGTPREVLAEWAELAAPLEVDLQAVLGEWSPRIITDVYSHEHDIRGAVGRPGARYSSAFPISLRLQLDTLGSRLSQAGLPALALCGEDGTRYVAGPGRPIATVRAESAWELHRAVTARRSRGQVLAYHWTGDDPERYLSVFFRWDPPAVDIHE